MGTAHGGDGSAKVAATTAAAGAGAVATPSQQVATVASAASLGDAVPVVKPRLDAATVSPVGGDPQHPPALVVLAATPAATPRILSVKTSPAVVHDGDTLLWNVRTTPDVVDVVAHVTAYAFRLQKQATGQYVLTFTIPHGVPGFFHGTYTLDLVAHSAAGAEATMKVPVTFQ